MADIQDYLLLSDAAKSVNVIFTNPKDFSEQYEMLYQHEKRSYLRHFFVNNLAYLFSDRPILYEQILQYLADKLGTSTSNIRLVGSGKIGFSMDKPPKYGTPFGPHSDLDFSIIDEEIFLKLEDEFYSWEEQYKAGLDLPKSEREKRYWDENLSVVPNQLKNGFIDTYKIPNHSPFELTRKINNCLYLIGDNLSRIHRIPNKKTSARVFSSWDVFLKRLKMNSEYVFKQLT